MKNYLLLLFAVMLFSCGEKNSPVEEPSPTAINITSSFFSPDRILQKKQTSFYVSLRLFKGAGRYIGTEAATLKVNNVDAKFVKKYEEVLEGTNFLFEVPAIATAGDYKAVFKLSIGNSSYVEEKTIRVVDDFTLNSIWSKLDYSYVEATKSFTNVYQSGLFSMGTRVTINGQILPPFGIGSYFTNYTNPSLLLVSKPFIAGLDGSYGAHYDERVLKEIRILMGNPNADQNFIKENVFAQLATLYGTPTITQTNVTKRTYKTDVFDIEVSDGGGDITAVIKKAR